MRTALRGIGKHGRSATTTRLPGQWTIANEQSA